MTGVPLGSLEPFKFLLAGKLGNGQPVGWFEGDRLPWKKRIRPRVVGKVESL